ncbi:MAG TPA: TMEM175 family protein [Thermoanaerobaculia bacterium]|nr:TMEM175 family protein [Thermoanaerobaculia bacterium]
MTRALRRKLAASGAGASAGFRWRGQEVSRLEGFTDAVFAFAVTLLVVSLEVPRSYDELMNVMRGFLAFAVCFAVLVSIWHEHYVFFRRYGLQDGPIVWLNAALLFVVLFYVYPLKFLFTLVINQLLLRLPAPAEATTSAGQARSLFLVYGSGVIAVFGMLALLYAHALRRREELGLDRVELFDTRSSLARNVLAAGVGAVSIAIALVVPEPTIGLAGYAYFLFGPVFAVHGSISGSRRRKVAASLAAREAAG